MIVLVGIMADTYGSDIRLASHLLLVGLKAPFTQLF